LSRMDTFADFGADMGGGRLPDPRRLDGGRSRGSRQLQGIRLDLPDLVRARFRRAGPHDHPRGERDVPLVADVNGDGQSDVGVFRKAIARWWFLCSPTWATTCLSTSFGVAGDVRSTGSRPACRSGGSRADRVCTRGLIGEILCSRATRVSPSLVVSWWLAPSGGRAPGSRKRGTGGATSCRRGCSFARASGRRRSS